MTLEDGAAATRAAAMGEEAPRREAIARAEMWNEDLRDGFVCRFALGPGLVRTQYSISPARLITMHELCVHTAGSMSHRRAYPRVATVECGAGI